MVKKASNRKMLLTKVAQHPRKCGYGSHHIMENMNVGTDKWIFCKKKKKDLETNNKCCFKTRLTAAGLRALCALVWFQGDFVLVKTENTGLLIDCIVSQFYWLNQFLQV